MIIISTSKQTSDSGFIRLLHTSKLYSLRLTGATAAAKSVDEDKKNSVNITENDNISSFSNVATHLYETVGIF